MSWIQKLDVRIGTFYIANCAKNSGCLGRVLLVLTRTFLSFLLFLYVTPVLNIVVLIYFS